MRRGALVLLLWVGLLAGTVRCTSAPELCVDPDGGTSPCDQGVECGGDTKIFSCGDGLCDSATQFCYTAIGVGGMRFQGTCSYYGTACAGACSCDCIVPKGSTTEQCTGTVATGIQVTHQNITN